MTRKCIPNWIEAYIKYTRFQEAPTLFHIWTALAAIATAAGRNVYIDRGYFKIFPNLYIALVGPTGITKSTCSDIGVFAMEDALKGVREIIRGKTSSWYLYDWLSKLTSSGKDCVCTIYADEMKDLFSDFNKTDIITLLTTMYTCPDSRDFFLKTGKLHLENVCFNVFTCTTPEWMVTGTSVNDIDGGFVGRFVHVYEDQEERSIPFPEDFMSVDTLVLRKELVEDLTYISSLKGKFTITDQAKAEYIIWHHDRIKECTDERLRGYFSRKRDLVFKVAMIVSLAKGDSLVIDETAIRTAFKLLSRLENKMGSAFSGVVEDPAMRYQDAVFALVAKSSTGISRAEILRRYANRFDYSILDRIIKNLLERQIIIQTQTSTRTNSAIIYKLAGP